MLFLTEKHLKSKRGVLLIAALSAILYGILFYVSGASELFFYGLTMQLFVLIVYFALDRLRFERKVKRLKDLLDNISLFSQEYPEADNCTEELYRETVIKLCEIQNAERKQAVSVKQEQIDYYTMWLHQIKTPISALELACQSESFPPGLMESELFKIRQYVEMALFYVKLDEPSSDTLAENCSLDEIISNCIKKYALLFIQKKMYINCPKSGITLTTDKKWLSFIIEQFLSNAAKYTENGGVDISFGENCVFITDTGMGIPAEDIPRVFEKGYTGRNGRIDYRASGLGLYMAKKAAAKLGVSLDVTSKLNCGTTAAIYFNGLSNRD